MAKLAAPSAEQELPLRAAHALSEAFEMRLHLVHQQTPFFPQLSPPAGKKGAHRSMREIAPVVAQRCFS